jgi:hypothetical protein
MRKKFFPNSTNEINGLPYLKDEYKMMEIMEKKYFFFDG